MRTHAMMPGSDQKNSVITERLLAATAMKTSVYIQNFLPHNVTSQMLCHPGEKNNTQKRYAKHSRYWAENCDSLPDFVTFVVSRFWK